MQKYPLWDKQAWILETRRKMLVDSKAMTLPIALDKTLLQKKPRKSNKLDPLLPKIPSKCPTNFESELSQKPNILIKTQKSDIFVDKPKKIFERSEKIDENQIPEPGEWEFEEEGACDYMKMMNDFEDKLEKRTSELSELEKMDLEHKKLKNMSQRMAATKAKPSIKK